MKNKRKISKSRGEKPIGTSSRAKVTTGDGNPVKSARPRRPKKAAPQSSNGRGPYKYGGVTYQSKAALIIGYLDAHKVFTGMVRPPNVSQFVRDTGVNVGHGMYGARLHEYCHTPRTDEDGTFTINRRALRAGKDGRVFQNPTTPGLMKAVTAEDEKGR
jgi:hypothetical protein